MGGLFLFINETFGEYLNIFLLIVFVRLTVGCWNIFLVVADKFSVDKSIKTW